MTNSKEPELLGQVPPRGLWIWRLARIRNDYLPTIQSIGARRVYLKVFDGVSRPRFWSFQCDRSLVQSFKDRGVELIGWGFHYGTPDISEQVDAVKQAVDCGLDGYVVDFESEEASRHADTDMLLRELRLELGSLPVGFTSFGHPGKHPNVPWRILDHHCDYHLPQIYFEKFTFGTNDEEEVQACLQSIQQLGLKKPVYPIWGSESDTEEPATAKELQSYLDRFVGSSVWRAPNVDERGEAWSLSYGELQ